MVKLLAKKSLGQHWLDDPASLEAMLKSADVGQNDTVLEIGPGEGSLTTLLVDKAKKVLAVELDSRLISGLRVLLPVRNLEVVVADILKFDLTRLPPDYKVVANIPYYLTSNLLRVLCESSNPFSSAALLVQKEVAERVAAKPGKMSLLSVSVQYYCKVELGPVVKANLFRPTPKVDSQILILKHLNPDHHPTNGERKAFFRLVKAGFSQRRKTLLNSLSGGLRLSKDQASHLIEAANLDPKERPQNLSLANWLKLFEEYKVSQSPLT